jgi:hypothetical protein
MRDPNYRPLAPAARPAEQVRPGADTSAPDITRDAKSFTSAIRTRIFTFLRAWAIGQHAAAAAALDARASDESDANTWSPDRLRSTLEEYRVEHGTLRFDPEARNLRHTHVEPSGDRRSWHVQQVLVDDEGHNDWMAEWDVDLTASREKNQPVLWLRRLGPIG